jgi:hypothetical protein
MKAKRFDKKLVLTKKTIAHLNNDEQKTTKGGAPTYMCPPTYTCTCRITGDPVCIVCPWPA